MTANTENARLPSGLLDVPRPATDGPVLHVVDPTVTSRHDWQVAAKRAVDVLGAGLLLLATLPCLLLAAVAIKLGSRGPVLFRQVRVGRGGRPFRVWKLRTMVVDAESRLEEVRALNEASPPLFKIRDDPRVTAAGRLLRRFAIDELPQLVNVLRGEMSLVGPRPALPAEAEDWGPSAFDRLLVKPGLTGTWQVRRAGTHDFEDYVRLDLQYVATWSLWVDFGILARTVPALLFPRRAA